MSDKICTVCESLISSIWMCTDSNCPEKVKMKTAEDRKRYLELASGNDEEEEKK